MLEQIRKWLAAGQRDGILISRRDNYSWLSGGGENHVLSTTETGVATLLITQEKLVLFADSSDAARMRDEQNGLGAEVNEVPWYESTEGAIRRAIEGRHIVSDTGMLATENVQPELVELRLPLTPSALTLYRAAGNACAEIVERVCMAAAPGQTEAQIAAMIKADCIAQGISPDCVLVGSDERILNYRHPMPTEKKIGHSLMVVLGGAQNGLNISMTRMVYFGGVPEEMASRYEKVQQIFANMQTMMADGLQYTDYFAAVVQCYAAAGYPDQWQKHHQGGPTGYACRERIIRPDSDGAVRKNQAYAWNPTIAGVKCEETTYLSEEGVETFTRTKAWPTKTIQTPRGSFDVAEILGK